MMQGAFVQVPQKPKAAHCTCLCHLGDSQLDREAVTVNVGRSCLIIRAQDTVVHLAVGRWHQH